MKNKIIIYARSARCDEAGLDKQVQECRNYCEAHGLRVVATIKETGSSIPNKSNSVNMLTHYLQGLSRLAANVVVTDLNRICRDFKQCRHICSELENAGITIHVATGDKPNPVELLLSEKIARSERIKAGIAHKKKAGGATRKKAKKR